MCSSGTAGGQSRLALHMAMPRDAMPSWRPTSMRLVSGTRSEAEGNCSATRAAQPGRPSQNTERLVVVEAPCGGRAAMGSW